MTVEVRGAVRFPTVLQYRDRARVNTYIKLCGGYCNDALKKNALVLNPDGTASQRKLLPFLEPRPLAGSVIIVPSETKTLANILETAGLEIMEEEEESNWEDQYESYSVFTPISVSETEDKPEGYKKPDVLSQKEKEVTVETPVRPSRKELLPEDIFTTKTVPALVTPMP